MSGRISWMNRMLATGATLLVAAAMPQLADAQRAKRAQAATQAAPAEAGPTVEYSKEFRKLAAKVQSDAAARKWAEVLAALPQLEALPNPTRDERQAIATWRLQATQAIGDQDAFAAAIELHLKEGYATADQLSAMHRQLAAHYSNKQDRAKTVEHFRQYVDATPDADAEDLETLGRLYLQVNDHAESCNWLGKAIDLNLSRKEMPKEMWFQLRDRCFIETKDEAARLANLEALVAHYPSKEYYSRIVAIYQNQTKDDRIVMLNAYRLAVSDPLGGLATVGGYLSYADTALVAGSPGDAARGLERGMKDGVVPSAGSNQQTLQEARTAIAQDRKSLPAEAAAAAKNPKGEVDVKLGLGFYSTGDFEQAVTVTRRGIAKGGVARLDDANMLLGAALMELGRRDEARAAFEAAAAAAPAGSHMARLAGLWLARTARAELAPSGG